MSHKLKRIILVFSIIVSIVSFIQNVNYGYGAIALLPLVYGIAIQGIPDRIVFRCGLTMMVLVLSLRYLLYPLLFVFQSLDSNIEKYFTPAISIMLIEIVVIVLTIKAYCKRHRNMGNSTEGMCLKKMNSLVPVGLLLLMVVIYIGNPDVYANRHFILNSEDINAETVQISGVLSQPMRWGEILITVFCFNYFCIKYMQTKNKSYFLMSVLILLVRCMFFSGHSRISLLMPFVTTIFILKKVYDKKANFTISLIVAYGIASLTILSVYKFFKTENVVEAATMLSPQGSAELINEYFGGVKNVMMGLNAYAQNGSSLIVWINDTFRNVMGISAAFEPDPRNSVTIFNLSVYQNRLGQGFDQICPTVIEGMLMFGSFLFFMPTILMVYVCCHFDNLFHKTGSVARAYVYAYVATLVGWALPGNYMHLCGLIFNSFIPMMLLISLNESAGVEKIVVRKTPIFQK